MLSHKDRKTAAYFDSQAREGFMEDFTEDNLTKLNRIINQWSLSADDRVLEVGCGSGRLTEKLTEHIDNRGLIHALDISIEMIRKAMARNLPDYVRFSHGSIDEISTIDHFFKTVLYFHVFPHLADPEAALKQTYRVLQGRGHFWINHLMRREEINAMHSTLTGVAAQPLPDDDEMTEILEKAGFDVLDIEDSDKMGYSVHAVKR